MRRCVCSLKTLSWAGSANHFRSIVPRPCWLRPLRGCGGRFIAAHGKKLKPTGIADDAWQGVHPSKARLGAGASCLRASPTSNQRASFKRGLKSHSRSPLGVPKSQLRSSSRRAWRWPVGFLAFLLAIEAACPRSRPGRWRKPSRPFREGRCASAFEGIGREMRFRKSPARASRGPSRQHGWARAVRQARKREDFSRLQVLQ